MPLYPPAGVDGRRRSGFGNKKLGDDPGAGSRSRCAGAASATMCSWAKCKTVRSPNASGCQGRAPATSISRRALALLSLPRESAKHPETASRSRRHRPLRPLCAARQDLRQPRERDDDVPVGSNRAVDLIAEKISGAGARARFGADAGPSARRPPALGGPYRQERPLRPLCQSRQVNATFPKGTDPALPDVGGRSGDARRQGFRRRRQRRQADRRSPRRRGR